VPPTTTDPMLGGMPEPESLRLLTHEGEVVVLAGRWVLFRFAVADTGMRRLAMVALTEAGHAVKAVAQVFGVLRIICRRCVRPPASRAPTGWSRRGVARRS
jgi:hypothetical protein